MSKSTRAYSLTAHWWLLSLDLAVPFAIVARARSSADGPEGGCMAPALISAGTSALHSKSPVEAPILTSFTDCDVGRAVLARENVCTRAVASLVSLGVYVPGPGTDVEHSSVTTRPLTFADATLRSIALWRGE